MSIADAPLRLTSSLLENTFGEVASSVPYLEWLYSRNPAGVAIEQNLDDAEGRIGHYAIIPKFVVRGETSWRIGLSLNTAVAARAQGRGLFTEMASRVFQDCGSQKFAGVIGVANAQSTPGFVRRLGFSLERPLPVRIGISIPFRREQLMSGGSALTAIASLEHRRRGADPNVASPLWTEDLLRWRFEKPGAKYFAFANNDGGIVGTRITQSGIAFACLMGVFARDANVRLGNLIAAACAEASTPFYVYAGWNRDFKVGGISVPMRLRPSPLNLIWRSLESYPTSGSDSLLPSQFRRFEFIDFDAY